VVFTVVVVAGAVLGGVYYSRYQRNLAALDRAQKSFAEGDWVAAKMNYRVYLSKYRDDYEVLKQYAEAAARLQNDRVQNVIDAASALFQVVRENPEDVEAADRMLELYKRAGQWGELERTTEFLRTRRTVVDPKLEYYHALALDRMGSSRAKEAETAYRALIEQDTPYIEVYGNLARMLRDGGLNEQGREVLDELVAKQPDNAQTYVQEVGFYLPGELEKARESYEKARGLAPEDAEVLFAGLLIAMEDEDWEKAVALGNRLLEVAPEKDEFYLPMAIAYQRQGDFESAINLIKGMDAYQRIDHPELLMTLAELQIGAEAYDEAREAIQFFRNAYPTQAMMQEYLDARLLFAQGEVLEALNKLIVVTETAPSFGPARYYVILAHLQLGEQDRARSALETYMRNFPADERAQALYQEQFVAGASIEGVDALAAGVLAGDATPDQLMTAARQLINQAQLQQRAQEVMDGARVVELLDRALELDPAHAPAYRLLATVYLARRDTAAAARTIDEAEAAGVAKSELREARAGLALTENDSEEAFGLFSEALAEDELTTDDVTSWANLFGAHGDVETGVRVLKAAAEKEPGEKAALYETRQVAFCTRHNEFELAKTILGSLDARDDLSAEARADLNRERVHLAEALMNASPPQREEAWQLLRQASSAGTRVSPRVRLLEAQLLVLQDPPQYAAAREKLDEALATEPNNVEVLLATSNLLMRQGDLQEAAEYAERAARQGPESLEAQLAHAQTLVEVGRHADAQEVLTNTLNAHPEALKALDLLVRSYSESGRNELAQIALKRLEEQLDATPEQQQALDAMRVRLNVLEGRNLDQAVDSLRTLYAANPDDLDTLRTFADALLKLDRFNEAERLVEGFLERHEEDVRAWVLLGQLHEARDGAGSPGSMSAYTRVLLMEPDYPLAIQGLARAQLAQNNPAEALALIERYLTVRPDDDQMLYEKARLLAVQADRLDEAVSAVSRAVELQPAPEYFYLRATLHLAQNNHQKALDDLQKIAVTGVSTVRYDAALAEAYWGVGQADLARRYLESVERKAEAGEQVDATALQRLRDLIDEEKGSA
jgi:tetratricopeptide (TPR) repeat protein